MVNIISAWHQHVSASQFLVFPPLWFCVSCMSPTLCVLLCHSPPPDHVHHLQIITQYMNLVQLCRLLPDCSVTFAVTLPLPNLVLFLSSPVLWAFFLCASGSLPATHLPRPSLLCYQSRLWKAATTSLVPFGSPQPSNAHFPLHYSPLWLCLPYLIKYTQVCPVNGTRLCQTIRSITLVPTTVGWFATKLYTDLRCQHQLKFYFGLRPNTCKPMTFPSALVILCVLWGTPAVPLCNSRLLTWNRTF